jgi:hypothetical protein
MMLPSGAVRDLTWQHMQDKCASQCLSLPKIPDKLLGVGWSKEKAKFSNMPWCGTTYKLWVTWEHH